MVEIIVRRDSRQRLSSVFVGGHAESGPYPTDLVCAAVSAIVQAAYAGLEDVAAIRLEAAERASGRVAFTIPVAERDRIDVSAIVATAEIALAQIARQYPQFVRVTNAAES